MDTNCITTALDLVKALKGSEIFKLGPEIKEDKMQISKLQSAEVEVIIVYRSEQLNLTHLAEHLKKLVSTEVSGKRWILPAYE
jgi:G:T-mismatch repair DNA endonuclease (very short patch repair protein)